MTHLAEHPHAYVKDGAVMQVAVFGQDAHDGRIVEDVRVAGGYDEVICCCAYGLVPAIGWTWDGTQFYMPPPAASA